MNWEKKYLKYKSKYLTLKNMSGGFNKNEVKYEGDYIIQKISSLENPDMGEYSSFNIKTKEVNHWYAVEICKNIIENIGDKNKPIKILVLGVALGGIIVHLLDKLPNSQVTGVDITSQHYHIVRKYSDNLRLNLLEVDANEYVKNPEPKFDVIICDIFDDITLPDFVLGYEFLNNIKNKLKPNGKFLINTLGIEIAELEKIFNNTFPNSKINILVRPDFKEGNKVSIIKI